ncbi:MAG TPA: hypothetical protein VFI47_14945, partial [Acidimicrobiales bacterium]|nr:hypothetical protein [Acidimicrobiales bacterium]
MPESSARPADLVAYRTAVGGMTESLTTHRGAVGAALDALRGTRGWSDFLADVPPLDIDLAAAKGRLQLLGTFVGQVGDAFAGVSLGPDGVGRLDDSV